MVPQEIVAERSWNLSQDEQGPVLYSVCHPVVWDGPTLRANVQPGKSDAYGIYAQRALEPCYAAYPVVGTVALSGIVVEGELGFRGECATIRTLRLRSLPSEAPRYLIQDSMYLLAYYMGGQPLAWKHPAWDVAEKLAARYCCDVTIDWLPASDLPAEELVA